MACDCLDEQAVKVDIDVGAMRREVAMCEGEARRFATWKVQPCATSPNWAGLWIQAIRLCIKHDCFAASNIVAYVLEKFKMLVSSI